LVSFNSEGRSIAPLAVFANFRIVKTLATYCPGGVNLTFAAPWPRTAEAQTAEAQTAEANVKS
jgi:hypothetical protein